jgi:trans-aconitate 2-methyltransferase
VDTPGSWDGAEYERVSALQRRVGEDFVDALPVDGVGSVLDVGCGDGYLTARLAARAPAATVLGVDASPGMIAEAQQRADGRMRFELADVLRFTSAETFDLVVSANTLHWVTDLGSALSRLAAVQTADATPPARLVCQLVPATPWPSIEDIADEVAASPASAARFPSGFRPVVHPSADELSSLVREAGYRVDDVRSWHETFRFPSIDDFARWCAVGMTAWTDHLEPAAREPFIAEVVERYGRSGPDEATLRFGQLRLSATRV